MVTQKQPICHFKPLIWGFQILGGLGFSKLFSIIFSCFKNATLLYVYYIGYAIMWNTLYLPEIFSTLAITVVQHHALAGILWKMGVTTVCSNYSGPSRDRFWNWAPSNHKPYTTDIRNLDYVSFQLVPETSCSDFPPQNHQKFDKIKKLRFLL